jgi:hypothetical protein
MGEERDTTMTACWRSNTKQQSTKNLVLAMNVGEEEILMFDECKGLRDGHCRRRKGR